MTTMAVFRTGGVVEENTMGWIIESNHLVDALLGEADRGEIVDIMQRRYGAAYQTVLALYQHIDALHGEISELRVQLAQKEYELEEIEQDRRSSDE